MKNISNGINKMKNNKILPIALILAFPWWAVASEHIVVSASAVGTLTGFVSELETRIEGRHSMYLSSGSMPNSDSCSLSDRSVIDETATGGKAIYAVALSASLNGSQVKVVTSGCIDIVGSSGLTAPKVVNIVLYTSAQ
jgi:hypothetical protein